MYGSRWIQRNEEPVTTEYYFQEMFFVCVAGSRGGGEKQIVL